MDCNSARSFLPFRRKGELDGPEADELNLHLARCAECNNLAAANRQFDEHLGRAVREVPVPSGLRGEILLRLAAERGEVQRRQFGRVARLAVAAAILLVLGAAGAYLWIRPPSRLQADEIVRSFTASPPGDAEAADRVLEPLGGSGGAPWFVNYAYQMGMPSMAVLPGYEAEKVKVPQFVFTLAPCRDYPRGERAVIFVIDQRKFKIDEAESYSDGDKYHFELYRSAPDAAFAYLVFYTGTDWDWLKARPAE